ncbi:hypothetical protein B0H14DRAFT_2601539 [Mycena olivaceomarginata]|nr:hypothetical protein B0H14DRAFT_2601539 [Mycena olivaceomarginata]
MNGRRSAYQAVIAERIIQTPWMLWTVLRGHSTNSGNSRLHKTCQFKEAKTLQVQVLEKQRQGPGEDHPDTLLVMSNLASTYNALGQFEEAEKLYVEVLQMQKIFLGEDDPDTGGLLIRYHHHHFDDLWRRWVMSSPPSLHAMYGRLYAPTHLLSGRPSSLHANGNSAVRRL